MDITFGADNDWNWAQSCRTARSQIAAIRFNADYDHFYETNPSYFCQARVTTD
jgi:hypothetical protein